jgi:hypothetical protein
MDIRMFPSNGHARSKPIHPVWEQRQLLGCTDKSIGKVAGSVSALQKVPHLSKAIPKHLQFSRFAISNKVDWRIGH